MYKAIDTILKGFRPLFSHKDTHYYFVLVLLGFILRFDHYGVSSSIRWLGLNPLVYDSLLHFFHTNAWSLDTVMSYWINWICSSFPTVEVNGRYVVLADNIKVSKEAEKRPGLVKCYQESGNSGKPKRFFGHNFGSVMLLVGSPAKYFATPLLTCLHEGVDPLRQFQEGREVKDQTIITRMIELIIITALKMNHPVYGVLDAYFATGAAFRMVRKTLTQTGEPLVHLIIKAKNSYVAYPSKSINQKEKIKLWNRFEEKDNFCFAKHPLHKRTLSYSCCNLFWGPAEEFIRFVWVIDEGRFYLLMCSDLQLAPIEIIQLYARRSKIEVAFLVMKQVIGGFCYRFWNKTLPKLSKHKEAPYGNQLLEDQDAQAILPTLTAIERFVNLAGIVMGILQYLALTYTTQIWKVHQNTSWLRTYSSQVPSEEVVQRAIQTKFFVSPHSRALAWCRTLIQQKNKQKENHRSPGRRKVPTHHTLPPYSKHKNSPGGLLIQ